MSASAAHARSALHLLHPSSPAARRAWGPLVIGVVGLFSASRFLGHAEFTDRLFAAMWLLFATAGLHSLRQACWTPQAAELAVLPIGRARRMAVEIAVYASLIVTLAAPLVVLLSLVSHRRYGVLDGATDLTALSAITDLGVVTLLTLPLLVAAAPGETRRGPLALLRLLLPWLPLGVAATAGWLADPAGLWLTLLVMSCMTGVLLAMRRTGWEDWWPRLPDLFHPRTPARPGLAHPARLEVDFRDGLTTGLGWGLGLTALAGALLVGTTRGVIPEDWQILAMLLTAGAFLTGTQTAMRIPLGARAPTWTPETIPWTLLPLPHGAMQRRIHSGQAIAWGVLAVAQALVLVLAAQGVAGDRSSMVAADFTTGLLLALMPIVMAWEGRFINSPWPPGPLARLVFVLMGLTSTLLPLAGARLLLDRLPDDALGWIGAAQHTAAVIGPAALVGLVWLVAGRVLILRDVAGQRGGGGPAGGA